MSETIPYNYPSPPAFYFQENGWFTCNESGHKNRQFVQWAFYGCMCCSHYIEHDGKKILLGPFEFLYSYAKCTLECGLSWKESRNRIQRAIDENILIKVSEKSTQYYQIFRWIPSNLEKRATSFSREKDQKRATKTQKGQPKGQPERQPKGQPDLGEENDEKGQSERQPKGQPKGQHSDIKKLKEDDLIDMTASGRNEKKEKEEMGKRHFKCQNGKVKTTTDEEIYEDLQAKGYQKDVIAAAIEKIVEQDPTFSYNANISNYVKKIIDNEFTENLKKEKYGKYNKKRNSQQDSLQRSRESFTQSSIREPSGDGVSFRCV
jgi:hypothetical protein